MIKIFLHYLWEKKFLQYAIVGSSAVIFDFLSLFFLREFLNINPVMAVAINQIFVINYVFFLNKYWSFKSAGQTVKQMIKFLILMVWNYSFAIFWMWFFTVWISWSLKLNIFKKTYDFWYLFVRLINILLAVSWNFLIYKYWVYKKKE